MVTDHNGVGTQLKKMRQEVEKLEKWCDMYTMAPADQGIRKSLYALREAILNANKALYNGPQSMKACPPPAVMSREVIADQAWVDRDACRYMHYSNVGKHQHRVRLSVGSFHNRNKNFATASVWGGGKWNTLYSIPYSRMATTVGPDDYEIDKEIRFSHFEDDIRALTKFVMDFFRGDV